MSLRKGCYWVFWIAWMILCVALVGGSAGYSIYVRIENPDLSETRLFGRCWWVYALMVVGCFGSKLLFDQQPWNTTVKDHQSDKR